MSESLATLNRNSVIPTSDPRSEETQGSSFEYVAQQIADVARSECIPKAIFPSIHPTSLEIRSGVTDTLHGRKGLIDDSGYGGEELSS